MDQDSVWHNFENFKRAVFQRNIQEKCICGPITTTDAKYIPQKNGFEINRWQITSGMLLKTELLNAIGGYNESYIVDCVDIELCLRAKSLGYNSYYCYDGYLKQRYGIPYSVMFLGKLRNYTYYNPFRVRGIIGGHIRLYRIYKHPHLPKEIRRYMKEAVKAIVYSHKQPINMILALIKGILDGLFK